MEIRKPSVKRDRGSPVIVPSTTRQKISWHKKLQSVTLIAMGLREGGSTYDYEVYLSIGDIQQIMESLAESGIGDCPNEISQEFSPKLDKLLKIMMCSVGFVPKDEGKKKT